MHLTDAIVKEINSNNKKFNSFQILIIYDIYGFCFDEM